MSFNYHKLLDLFDLDLSKDIKLVRYEVITPDSSMWRLLINDGVYYLYCEDFVSGLSYIKRMFNQYLRDDKWSFVQPKEITHEDTSLWTEEEADDVNKMMQHAAMSNHEYVFLVRSTEDPSDVRFSRFAPGGFVPKD